MRIRFPKKCFKNTRRIKKATSLLIPPFLITVRMTASNMTLFGLAECFPTQRPKKWLLKKLLALLSREDLWFLEIRIKPEDSRICFSVLQCIILPKLRMKWRKFLNFSLKKTLTGAWNLSRARAAPLFLTAG